MNRSKRFITALLSSYATIAVNTVYALASIPLALHYLNKEEFGLWVLVTQLAGYLMLLEFGMSGSVARSLADHKDNIQDGKYGSILRTGGRVFAIQGLVVAMIGLLLAWTGPAFLNIPVNLQKQFTYLMAAQSLLGGLRLSFGSFVSPLWSHQRLDISNFASSTGLIVSFFVQWIGFKLGWQLYSLTIATASGLPISLGIIWISCKRLGYYPPRQYRGCFEPKIFRELFQFGGGIFLMNLGSQLTSASQVIVISRILGIDAAATWSVSTKIYSMAQQFVLRMLDSSAGGLTEMLVRKELNQLQKRFTDLISISAVIAMAACAGITLMNGSFIEYWTSGKVYWDPWNNLLLGCLLFVSTITKFHTGLVGISKDIRGMKYIYLIEGLMFVTVSFLLVPKQGLAGLLYSALLCNIAITGVYGVSRTASYFGISKSQVIAWVARPVLVLLITSMLFAITTISSFEELSPLAKLICEAILWVIVIVPSLWFVGLDSSFRNELKTITTNLIARIKS